MSDPTTLTSDLDSMALITQNTEELGFFLSFLDDPDTSLAEANRYAAELRQDLLRAAASLDEGAVEVRRTKDNPQTQDFGATLLLSMGVTAAPIIANTIRDFLKRRPGATLTMKMRGRTISATGLTSEDAAKLFSQHLLCQ